MINKFKALDNIGLISYLSKAVLAIRQFFATKREIDVVATALTDLNNRINDKMPNISVGTVTTVDSNTDADVTISKIGTDVKLNFLIPRGPQGDMYEKDDAGYTDLEGRTYVYYCQAAIGWQYQSDTNYLFVSRLQVPIPSYNVILSKADCIRMTKDVTLLVGNATYKWSLLHWLKQCSSDSKNQIVYVTKYGTDDSNIPFSINKDGKIKSVPATIEIVVSCNPGAKALYYIQITVENVYGKAYYSYIGQITDTNKKEIDK